jgi:hypothetical protein
VSFQCDTCQNIQVLCQNIQVLLLLLLLLRVSVVRLFFTSTTVDINTCSIKFSQLWIDLDSMPVWLF